jgi:hypothetical protein
MLPGLLGRHAYRMALGYSRSCLDLYQHTEQLGIQVNVRLLKLSADDQ